MAKKKVETKKAVKTETGYGKQIAELDNKVAILNLRIDSIVAAIDRSKPVRNL